MLSFWTAIAAIVSVMLSDFFDTMGTASASGRRPGCSTRTASCPGSSASCSSTVVAAAVGGAASSSSSNTTYIESGAGIGDGGRTGLTSVVVGVLFLAGDVLLADRGNRAAARRRRRR